MNNSLSKIIKIETSLSFKDRLGACKVRLGFGRMSYSVLPGLYGIGNPDENSLIFVSSNYKLTFDKLRKELTGLNCFLLILDTEGINVWCAANKKTFGTSELINRIEQTRLVEVVKGRSLILPQLGAPGIDSNEVTKQTGFAVDFGPIRAKDIKKYLENDCHATKEMRTVNFNFLDRLVLTPVELMSALKTALFILGLVFVLNLFIPRTFDLTDFIIFLTTIITGTVIVPSLLPVIPSKFFAVKGWLVGLIITSLLLYHFGYFEKQILLSVGYLFSMPAIAAYLALTFTGSTTFTSQSSVTKEVKLLLPFMIAFLGIGVILLLINAFIGG